MRQGKMNGGGLNFADHGFRYQLTEDDKVDS